MSFSSAADMHPGAPKTVQGNAALMDEREPTDEELRKIETALYPPGINESEIIERSKKHLISRGYRPDQVNKEMRPDQVKTTAEHHGYKSAKDKASISWPDYPVKHIMDPENNPKNLNDAGNEDLFSQTKVSGGGGNSGAVVSPNPFGGLSAYQDPNAKVGKLPQHSGLDSISVDESPFAHLEHKLAHKSGVTNPAALAAKIGREKLGQKEMTHRSVEGRE